MFVSICRFGRRPFGFLESSLVCFFFFVFVCVDGRPQGVTRAVLLERFPFVTVAVLFVGMSS